MTFYGTSFDFDFFFSFRRYCFVLGVIVPVLRTLINVPACQLQHLFFTLLLFTLTRLLMRTQVVFVRLEIGYCACAASRQVFFTTILNIFEKNILCIIFIYSLRYFLLYIYISKICSGHVRYTLAPKKILNE